MSVPGHHVLDDPIGSSLSGVHQRLALRAGRVARYRPDVAPFAALPAQPDPQDWADLAGLVDAGVAVFRAVTPPADWTVRDAFDVVQMVRAPIPAVPDPGVEVLSDVDVPEILDLVERTRPGPFLARSHELGRYLGVRRGGALVALAGERFHPAGWTEISAVCTDPAYRGRGLAARLVDAVAAGITARDEGVFLHVVGTNHAAIRLYATLGFTVRRHLQVTVLAPPKE